MMVSQKQHSLNRNSCYGLNVDFQNCFWTQTLNTTLNAAADHDQLTIHNQKNQVNKMFWWCPAPGSWTGWAAILSLHPQIFGLKKVYVSSQGGGQGQKSRRDVLCGFLSRGVNFSAKKGK